VCNDYVVEGRMFFAEAGEADSEDHSLCFVWMLVLELRDGCWRWRVGAGDTFWGRG
jgi:hypothetical protein